MKKFCTKLFFLLLFSFPVNAQHLTHDIGFFIGTTKFQTDYGEENSFTNSLKNGGTSFTIAHYLGFYKKNFRWNSEQKIYNYFLIKNEITFINKTNLEHLSKWALGNSESAQKLRAMKGSISLINLGLSLEYYLKFLDEYFHPYNLGKLNPFFTFGVRYSFYKNNLVSDLGDWRQDITILPEKYRTPGALSVGSGGAVAFTFGAGTRYRLTKKMDLTTQINSQIYFSDAIDGLQPDVVENKNNEWFLNFQFGVVYHLSSNGAFYN